MRGRNIFVRTGKLCIVIFYTFLFICVKKPTELSDGEEKPKTWECVISKGEEVDYSTKIGCWNDFVALASEPMSATIPGAMSVKTVIDQLDPSGGSPLYFQNSKKYKIHWDFASKHLSGNGKIFVPSLAQFNSTEYTTPDRRFILGEITYYEGPKIWAYQIASNDNASPEMISFAMEKISDSCYFGDSLYFHPMSEAQSSESFLKKLPSHIKVITTEEIYKNVNYQPLNCGTSIGRLVFVKASVLSNTYVGFRDIVVLDVVPNDISVTSGIITDAFQTPLAHINVLSHNRGTPNMALRGAWTDSTLRSLEGKWVRLTVDLLKFTIEEVSAEEADKWWEEHRPPTVGIPAINLNIKDLRNVEDILDLKRMSLAEALDSAIPAFGGKASHFAAFPHMDSTKVRYPKAFAIPVYYYWKFMEDNGFNAKIRELLKDDNFNHNAAVRDSALAALREEMMNAPIGSELEQLLFDKLNREYAGMKLRFRSSTNAEDLDGFTGAGLYTSEGGKQSSPKSVREAIRIVWSSVWSFRAFEERSYRNIDHLSVGMAILVHRAFTSEEATGVAITKNIYDRTGMDPGFYINVQYGDNSVVLPDSNVTTDEIIYKFGLEGNPIIYLGHSNILPEGQSTVLTPKQLYTLGMALQEIHQFFQPVYGKDPTKPYAMDTEFKFDQPLEDPNGEPVLYMKQCRPYY